MTRISLLLLLLLAPLIPTSGCVIQSGPSCADACEAVLACSGLDKTFRLSCSASNNGCFDVVAECAVCIEEHTCDELVSGACDLREDGGALCLVE